MKKTDAHSLMSVIESFLLAKGIDISKTRFVGFDGTNTMSGEVSGKLRMVTSHLENRHLVHTISL